MDWFPKLNDYSPQKVNNVVKQAKAKQQQQKQAEDQANQAPEDDVITDESPKKNDGLLDIYV